MLAPSGQGGPEGHRGRLILRSLAQDHPHLVFDRAAVTGCAQPEFVADGVVELSDGEIGHGRPQN